MKRFLDFLDDNMLFIVGLLILVGYFVGSHLLVVESNRHAEAMAAHGLDGDGKPLARIVIAGSLTVAPEVSK